MNANAPTIGLVENNVSFLSHFVGLLKSTHTLRAAKIHSWTSAETFWRDTNGRSLDLLFLDIMLPNMSGVELVGYLSRRNPSLTIIMLTNVNSDELIFRALRQGAVGYVLKSELNDILMVVETVLNGGAIITPTIAFRVLKFFKKTKITNNQTSLTTREREILDHLICGRKVARVAELLQISGYTVRTHVKNIYRKLKVHNRAELVNRVRIPTADIQFPEDLASMNTKDLVKSGTAAQIVNYFRPRSLSQSETEHNLLEALTLREQDVLHLLITGAQNQRIASEMQISENTIRFHIKNIYRKLNVNNRAALVKAARELGFYNEGQI